MISVTQVLKLKGLRRAINGKRLLPSAPQEALILIYCTQTVTACALACNGFDACIQLGGNILELQKTLELAGEVASVDCGSPLALIQGPALTTCQKVLTFVFTAVLHGIVVRSAAPHWCSMQRSLFGSLSAQCRPLAPTSAKLLMTLHGRLSRTFAFCIHSHHSQEHA